MNVMVNEDKPVVWIKWEPRNPNNVPLPRSGHTMTLFKGRFYMFGGIVNGLNDPAIKRVAPSNDVYILDAFQKNKYDWTKPGNVNGDIPSPRANHTATAIKKENKEDCIIIFGGLGEKGKLDDIYKWEPHPECHFTKIEVEGDKPAPRAGHSACFYDGKVYMFGGNGGRGYENSVFKDLWAFDVEAKTWSEIKYAENPSLPELRTGQTMFIHAGNLYVYGGWNTVTGFYYSIKYNFKKNEWSSTRMELESLPVWNHCGLEVESGPSWKYFSFGGSSKVFDETKSRERADCCNKITVYDLDKKEMKEVPLESEEVMPQPREDATMVYMQSTKNLLIFGGWNNEWYGDIYGICVSSIVGPSYSVKKLVPDKGRISGGQRISLMGSKLGNGIITVFFILGNKEKHVGGEFISEEEIQFITPGFIEVGAPKELEVKIKIDAEELSTNKVYFNIYHDTKPDKTIFFGPALLEGCTPGTDITFYIRARNEFNQNRESGRDEFKVTIVSSDMTITEEGVVEDLDNGTYKVTFKVPNEDTWKINVQLVEDKQGGDKTTTDIRGSPIKVLFNGTDPANNEFTGNFTLTNFLKKYVEELDAKMKELYEGVDPKGKNLNDIYDIIKIKKTIKEIEREADSMDLKITQCYEYYVTGDLDHKKSSAKGEITLDTIKKLGDYLDKLKTLKESTSAQITPIINKKTGEYQEEIKAFYSKLNTFGQSIKEQSFAKDYSIGYTKAFELLADTKKESEDLSIQLEKFDNIMTNLSYPEETEGCKKSLQNSKNEIELIDRMWNYIKETQELLETFKKKTWPEIDGQAMDEEISMTLTKKNNKMRKDLGSYLGIMDCVQKEITKWRKLVPLVTCLKSESMKQRHWDEFKKELNCENLVIDDKLCFQTFYDMELHNKADQITEITDKATSEDKMGKKLEEIKANWEKYEYELIEYPRVPGVNELKFQEDPYADLEDNIQQIESMIRNKYKAFYEKEVNQWKSDLSEINEVWVALNKTQVKWKFLESLFIGSDEIKKELPNETADFEKINVDVKEILKIGTNTKNILKFSTLKFKIEQSEEDKKKEEEKNMEEEKKEDNPEGEEGDEEVQKKKKKKTERSLLEWLNNIIERLEVCEKALNAFMDTKRIDFPRFYFMSPPDLLDVLSNGDSPISINKHISKIIIAMDTILMEEKKGERPTAKVMKTRNGIEEIPFTAPFPLLGKVERYLQLILDEMKKTMKDRVKASIKDIESLSQMDWIKKTPSQVCLLTDLMKFVGNCETGIQGLKNNADSMKTVYENQLKSLNALIKSILEEMTLETMSKVMVLIKAETHSRDVIEKLINEKVARVDDFVWQAQMKAYWSNEKNDCHLNVCDAELWYGYEYLGNGDRLVVTPLTDRIYVTATQALHLKMGCSPAGPAGTGKTETTKDLSSAMGKACYVFNCSEQMDYQTMGDIFRGLAASGSWGCFDEFNRLIPEVLSVCSMQFKCVTDALKKGQTEFIMEERKGALDPTCGVFITMNPGYLGRSELPEGLKALFRPITVVVPDYELISENCLMAQGFEDAKMLAKKFVVLYALCEDLLSKQMHYDWGLRAIKSVLVVAGAFKRADRDMSELQLLKRALRDFSKFYFI